MKTTLITGHNGFVGTNLIHAWQNSLKLIGLDIPQCDSVKTSLLPPEKSFSWDQLDDLPGVDTIIHLAGKAHDTANVSAPGEYFEVNLDLTIKIYDHFLRSEAHTFVFFSSVKAIADTVEGSALTEDDKPNPKTPYGQSKLAAEQYIQKNVPNASSGKRIFILRPAMIHGPGNKGNLNLLYKIVQKRIPWPLGSFKNRRSFLSVENLVYILNQIMTKQPDPGVYHLADDEPLSTNELIGLMAESLSLKPRIWSLPKRSILTLARAGDVFRLPLNSERLKKLTENYVVSNARIKKAIQVQSLPVGARQGMLQTLSSFNKNNTHKT